MIKTVAKIKSWAEWFDRRAQYYDNPLLKMAYYIDGKPVSDDVMRATIDDVRKKMRIRPADRLLDVGGGVGLFTNAFRSKRRRLFTTDISFNMVRDARAMNRDSVFLVCEASALPFEDSSFDKVLCYSVFHYLRDAAHVKKVLKEFARVVRDGGFILIGDIPTKVHEIKKIVKPPVSSGKSGYKHPPFLKHDLKRMVFEPKFFIDFFAREGLKCRIAGQKIKGKVTSSTRFDVMVNIKKRCHA